jgi:hypothetical protein
VTLQRGGISYYVSNAEQAARMLLDDDWPDTKLSLAARKCCLAAMGNGSSEKARTAFLLAIEELGSQSATDIRHC